MTLLKPLADDYNYYPRTMIRLCNLSYDDFYCIPNEVQQLGWEVVWGPAELVSWLDISYTLAYICRRQQPYNEGDVSASRFDLPVARGQGLPGIA